MLPLLSVNTTAGTAAEMTRFWEVVWGPCLLPALVLPSDPSMRSTLPCLQRAGPRYSCSLNSTCLLR